MNIDRTQLQTQAAALAARGVFVGTSSWKYPGWQGQIYDEARYVYRGKFSNARFEKNCLAEYADVFKTVCVDAAYYKFPDRRWLEGMSAQVPADFRFAFKVTDEITIKKFPNLPRFGVRAGGPNANFLNPDLFASAFLAPCESIRPQVGLLMFEFSKFYPADFARGRDFVEALDAFLGALPSGWPYGVEIRNRHFLHGDYFACLARHGVTHVFNGWEDMPAVGEQLAMDGSRTNPRRLGARFLLTPGRKYADAVKRFSPYDRMQEPDAAGQSAGAQIIRDILANAGGHVAFIYVNNRFEGNALATIAAMIDQASAAVPPFAFPPAPG